MVSEERYSLERAEQLLHTSKSALVKWIKKAGLTETIRQQRPPDDMREHFITRSQLELLASQHRRILSETPAPDAEAIDSALSERIEALEEWKAGIEQRVAALEAARSQFKPIPGRKKPEQ